MFPFYTLIYLYALKWWVKALSRLNWLHRGCAQPKFTFVCIRFSLLSLLSTPLWSDSGEGWMRTSSSCQEKWREAVGDFVWKIKSSPSEATGARSCPRRGKPTPSALLHLWCWDSCSPPQGHFVCYAEVAFLVSFSGNVSKVAVAVCDKWIATDEIGTAQPLFAKTAWSYWNVL